MRSETQYTLRFFFEWGGGCLWPGDDATRRDFDLGPYDLLEPCPLPLSAEVLAQCRRLAAWYDTSLNWDYPPDPGPWRQAECERFNLAVSELLTHIRRELEPVFQVANCQTPAMEDPELDAYLADPKGFHRREQ
jgi:hypothetical protein